MLSKILRLAFLWFFLAQSGIAFALPSPSQVQAQINAGSPEKALLSLDSVLKANPQSAVAWFLKAEALDAMGKTAAAKEALTRSEAIDPNMPFAKAKRLQELETKLGVTNPKTAEMRKSEASLTKIVGLILVLALIAGGVFLVMRKRSIRRSQDAERTALAAGFGTLLQDLQDLQPELASTRAQNTSDTGGHDDGGLVVAATAFQALKSGYAKAGTTAERAIVLDTARQALQLLRQKLDRRPATGINAPTASTDAAPPAVTFSSVNLDKPVTDLDTRPVVADNSAAPFRGNPASGGGYGNSEAPSYRASSQQGNGGLDLGSMAMGYVIGHALLDKEGSPAQASGLSQPESPNPSVSSTSDPLPANSATSIWANDADNGLSNSGDSWGSADDGLSSDSGSFSDSEDSQDSPSDDSSETDDSDDSDSSSSDDNSSF
jgi:hypothetical protein